MEYIDKDELQRKAIKTLEGIKGKVLTVKERIALPPQEMPTLPPKERARLINEVATGYTPEQAIVEASRCLQCKTSPCVAGCPVNVKIPEFIKKVSEGDFPQALSIIQETNLLPSICGRVCPQETQCQGVCTLGKSLKDVNKAVSIGRLERFVSDYAEKRGGEIDKEEAREEGGKSEHYIEGNEEKDKEKVGEKRKVPSVAIVGAGPAGLTVAADCARAGYNVTVFEALHKAGGVMMYGIPEFRLPKRIVNREVENLKKLGVKFCFNYLIGRTRGVEDLLEKEFDAVFIGTGAGLPKFLNIKGENLIGVFSANEYLTRANLMKGYDKEADTPVYKAKKVCVVGGGNVAMDAARMALRLGAESVTVIYRRTRAEMPARNEEIEHAIEEGVEFRFLENPIEVLGTEDGKVKAVNVLSYKLGEPDASGRRRPVAIEGSEHIVETDCLIVALGNESNPLLVRNTKGLNADNRGHIVVQEGQATSIERVWAGGDIVLGSATVILAMGEGRIAAKSIKEALGEVKS